MPLLNILKASLVSFLICQSAAHGDTCVKADQSINMCKGHGFCTMFPIGKDGDSCGVNWTIPNNWKAMQVNCLNNMEERKTYSCANGGNVKSVICGKSNCYTCVCK